MNKEISEVYKRLESIKHFQDGLEYWSARELMPLLGYKEWRKFVGVIKKAKSACKESGLAVEYHFVGADKMIKIATGSQRETLREVRDVLLTRYACYLIAQNGDSRKSKVAFAQTYFAVQTRRQELEDQLQLEDKRLEARQKLQETEGKIEQTIYERGISLPTEFASFKDKHIQALYGGIGIRALKQKRNIPLKRALADFDQTVELRAKDFALAMTDHNIKEKNLLGQSKLEKEVVENSRVTRRALLKRGIKPEELKPEEDIKRIEDRRKEPPKLLHDID